jgi:hypothetical protein
MSKQKSEFIVQKSEGDRGYVDLTKGDAKPFTSTSEALAWLKAQGQSGLFRVIAVTKVVKVQTEQITKVHLS